MRHETVSSRGWLNVWETSEEDKKHFSLRVGIDLWDMEQFSLKVGFHLLVSGWA